MTNYVFKEFFHGKCQNRTTGIDPPGCPNPDCPVVCGTPGSIVHFYSVFKTRAFTCLVRLVEELTSPNSTAFQQVENAIEEAASTDRRRGMLRFMRNLSFARGDSADRGRFEKRQDHGDRTLLRRLLRQFRPFLTMACGGTASGKHNGLPNCSWEDPFKQYILTFP